MTLSIGTLPNRRHQPVRVINAVYPVQTREQRRLLARNAGHTGRLVAIGVALLITAFAVFNGAGGSNRNTEVSIGLPVIVPEARNALPASCVAGFCSASYLTDGAPAGHAYEVAASAEGRA